MWKLKFLALLLGCTVLQAQIVDIPDPNFKNALVNTLCVDTDGDGFGDTDVDSNDDGEVQLVEAAFVVSLRVNFHDISSLDGIEAFSNLEVLDVGFNQLANLDVSQNLYLQQLLCDGNEIVSLDLSQSQSLEWLSCSGNMLTNLDLSQNSNLRLLQCYSNALSGLDVTQCPNLDWLGVAFNNLQSLDVSQNSNLIRLYAGANQLLGLDVSNNPNLTFLGCGSNQLEYLNLQNGNNEFMEHMNALNNPALFCIQVDDATVVPAICNSGTSGWCKDNEAVYSENCSLSIDDFTLQSVSVYPNPVKHILKITSMEGLDQITIFTASGGSVITSQETEIDVSNLPSGIYFVNVYWGGQVLTKKVVKL